jgi:hypothetical protein
LSFASYSDLQDAGANWLGRTSSAFRPRIRDFITLAEAQIARDLLRYTTFATITIAAETNNLPAGVKELRSVRLVTDSASLDRPLIITTPEELANRRAQTGNAPGRPLRAALFNDGTNQQLLVQPTPDGLYNAEISYFIKLVPLSDENTSNLVLVEAPDLYLFGLLKESAPFLENDERVPLWEQKYAAALASLMALKDREEYTASRRPVPLEKVFS